MKKALKLAITAGGLLVVAWASEVLPWVIARTVMMVTAIYVAIVTADIDS